MRWLFIFDLDGTLADMQHRVGLIPNWDEFFAACVRDSPIENVIITMEKLKESGAEIWVWSGRNDSVREETEEWMQNYLGYTLPLKMRPTKDHRPDEELKEKWLSELSQYDRGRLVGVFDDRDRVVAMWRRNGITCFQVAPGNF